MANYLLGAISATSALCPLTGLTLAIKIGPLEVTIPYFNWPLFHLTEKIHSFYNGWLHLGIALQLNRI